MARLLIKTAGLENQTMELRPGVNRIGGGPDNDFVINHPSISANHCELILTADGLILRDCDSSSGSFLDGYAVTESKLRPGQTITLGDVELFVESTAGDVSIPKYDALRRKPGLVLTDEGPVCSKHSRLITHKCTNCGELVCVDCIGFLRRVGGDPLYLCPNCNHKCEPIIKPETANKEAPVCPRHPNESSEYQCTQCNETMCGDCVHVLKRKGGRPIFLCPFCGQPCERLQKAAPKRRGLVKFLKDTVRLRFTNT